MGDKKNLNELKTQYRSRFYRDGVEDLPEVQPGSNVLSAIKVYFKKSGGDESPASSTSSFLADSVTNINAPESFLKKHGSSTNPRVSKLKGLQFTGEITETKMNATKSPTVNEKVKTSSNNFNVNVVSEEEMEDCESDMPLNLVVEKEKENEIVRLVRRSRDWMYNPESSVVQEPPDPATKSSLQKRLRFSNALGSGKASFANIFASKYKSGPADDDQTILMQNSVRYVDKKTDPSPKKTTESVAKEDEEFVIEDEQTINMSFSLVNKRSSAGSPQETRSTTSNSVCGNQKLQSRAVEVFSGQSPFCLSRGNPTRKESSQNVYRIGTTDDISRDILSAETPKTTKITPLSATNESQKLSIKSKARSDQPLSYSKPIQLTRQTIRELELSEEEDFESIWNTKRKKIKIPRTSKAKAEISESSSVSHQKAEIESAEKVSEQSTTQSQMVKKTLRDDKTNKVKDTLCEDPNSLAPPSVEIVTIEPPIKRKNITDYSDLPVFAEDEEFVIHDITDFDSNSKSWKKKPLKIPNDVKKNKKSQKSVPSEVLNVTYTSAKKSDSIVTDSRESHNDPSDSSSPYQEKKEKTSRRSEADKLVLQKYLQTDLENQNDRTSSRPKRLSAPPSDWWVVQQAGRKFGMEEALPEHSRKSKRKASIGASLKILELQNDDEESFELKERSLDENEKSLKKSDEKSSKTINTRKKTKKRKPVERAEMAGPSKVKKPKNNKGGKKSQAATKKSLKATKSRKQLEYETQESESLSTAAIPASLPISDPQRLKYLEKRKSAEEEEPQTCHRLDTDNSEFPVLAEDEEFVMHDITDFGDNSRSWNKNTHKIPNDSKKNKISEKNVACQVLNATYTSAKKNDSSVTHSLESHNDTTDSSSPYQEKKGKRPRRNEVDKLVLQKYLQFDVDNQNEGPRPKRLSARPSAWWVVPRAGRKSTIGMEEALPEHSPESKRKGSVRATKETSEWQNDDEESFELKERPLEKDAKSLKKSDEKFSKTIDARKISKKQKPVEREEMAGPSKVKKSKNKKACKKPQAATKKSLKATRLWKQLGREIRESCTTSSPEHDLNVHDLPYEVGSLSVEAIPTSPTMNDPQCPTLKRRKPILHQRDIQPQYLENYKPIEEEEPQPNHRLPRQSHTSPDYESAKLTFQSGPVIKTKPMRYNNPMDGVVRNLTSAESFNVVEVSPLAIVRDPETNSDTFAECIHHANRAGQGNPSQVSMCFNNNVFSAGNVVLGPMEMEIRDTPQIDIMVYYVVSGRIMLKLHKSYHSLKSGDFFFIPPGNTYHIQNREKEDAEVVYTQLKSGSN